MNSVLKKDKFCKCWIIPNTENDILSFHGLGIPHKENGPAVEYYDGTKYWFINGKWHRTNGPACEYSNGNKGWFINGLPHRQDGPALEWSKDKIHWFLKNKKIYPTLEMMEKYIRLNPDNILKDWEYPLEIQLLAISLKQNIIFNIKYPNPKLKQLYPKQMILKNSGLI